MANTKLTTVKIIKDIYSKFKRIIRFKHYFTKISKSFSR